MGTLIEIPVDDVVDAKFNNSILLKVDDVNNSNKSTPVDDA